MWGTSQVRMPSGEVRMIHQDCQATIGQVSNIEDANVSIGKAGRTRWLGKRPHQRGVTMNPVDHPMGGGEGRTSGGRHPCSPWGQLSKGLKTRNNNGDMVPIGSVTTFRDATGPFRVPRYNLYPAAEIQLSLARGFSSTILR